MKQNKIKRDKTINLRKIHARCSKMKENRKKNFEEKEGRRK